MINGKILKTLAIPLIYTPYSSSSRIVQWITRDYGKITTILKGALRPKSPFLGEYALFGTSELLYYSKPLQSLLIAKECALINPRNTFRTQWKAMQAVSYLSMLIRETTPPDSPQPRLFSFFEKMLDLAQLYGNQPQFAYWAKLKFFDDHGHAPHFVNYCSLCGAKPVNLFAPTIGTMICRSCAEREHVAYLPCPPDTLALLRAWQRSNTPQIALKTFTSPAQWSRLCSILNAFIQYHFQISS